MVNNAEMKKSIIFRRQALSSKYKRQKSVQQFSIIADIVINHMVGANMEGYGWHGSYFKSTPFEEYFPSVPYNETDFHDKICDGNIEDYGNRWQVRNCRLVNLVDLDHSNPNVQASIVAYMNRLIDIGVAGFRIDAAKSHVARYVEKNYLSN
ncbi:alpha-amylase [Trichinella spiralis]|uniref:alpha-amylase n=1 Tax=Trichinella spiralis TaxID=6334 RepID=UPI0001EFD468|nr:alpha-amylase [Trichinella spiralis]